MTVASLYRHPRRGRKEGAEGKCRRCLLEQPSREKIARRGAGGEWVRRRETPRLFIRQFSTSARLPQLARRSLPPSKAKVSRSIVPQFDSIRVLHLNHIENRNCPCSNPSTWTNLPAPISVEKIGTIDHLPRSHPTCDCGGIKNASSLLLSAFHNLFERSPLFSIHLFFRI